MFTSLIDTEPIAIRCDPSGDPRLGRNALSPAHGAKFVRSHSWVCNHLPLHAHDLSIIEVKSKAGRTEDRHSPCLSSGRSHKCCGIVSSSCWGSKGRFGTPPCLASTNKSLA